MFCPRSRRSVHPGCGAAHACSSPHYSPAHPGVRIRAPLARAWREPQYPWKRWPELQSPFLRLSESARRRLLPDRAMYGSSPLLWRQRARIALQWRVQYRCRRRLPAPLVLPDSSSSGSPPRLRLLLFDLICKLSCIAVLHRLQMLAVQDQFPRHLENFVGHFHHSHGRILRPFFQIGADRIYRVADKYRLDEAQLVVAVAEGMDIVVSHQPQPHAEHHGAGHQALAEYAFLFRENFVGDVGMHVQHQSVEGHALAFRDRSPDGAGAQAHFEILVEPVFLVPNANGFVFRGVGVWVCHFGSSLALRTKLLRRESPPKPDVPQIVC